MFEVTKNNINLIIDNDKIGYILFDEKDDYIVGSHIYVNPEFRGQGHSRRLIDEFIRFVMDKNKPVIATCPVIKRELETHHQDLLKK